MFNFLPNRAATRIPNPNVHQPLFIDSVHFSFALLLSVSFIIWRFSWISRVRVVECYICCSLFISLLFREMVDGLGVTMELDTDGIWCLLPRLFPLRYSFLLKESGKEFKFEYPTWVLNTETYVRFRNPQYLHFNPEHRRFEQQIVNEVFFELDGPWRAMFLPASEKSDDLLKKRYVVHSF